MITDRVGNKLIRLINQNYFIFFSLELLHCLYDITWHVVLFCLCQQVLNLRGVIQSIISNFYTVPSIFQHTFFLFTFLKNQRKTFIQSPFYRNCTECFVCTFIITNCFFGYNYSIQVQCVSKRYFTVGILCIHSNHFSLDILILVCIICLPLILFRRTGTDPDVWVVPVIICSSPECRLVWGEGGRKKNRVLAGFRCLA